MMPGRLTTPSAVGEPEFIRLGLTDVVSLVTTLPDRHLLTVDLDLYLAALNRGREAFISAKGRRGSRCRTASW
jgi:hypothetical protein